MNKQHPEKRVPELRFPEFEGEWITDKLKQLTTINQGLQIPISKRLTKPEKGALFYITNEFLKKNSKKKYYIKNPPESVTCTPEDILMTRTGNTGQVVTNITGAFHNNFFKIKYKKEKLNKGFLVYFLRQGKTQHTILTLAGASTIPDLNHGDFYRLRIPYPQFQEQQKIATFLSAIDHRIELLQRKKEQLELYKKGVMQKIFTQEIRFKDKNGKDFPEWEEKRLGDIGFFYYGKSAPKHSLSDDAPTPCVRYGELYTKFNGKIDHIHSYTNIPPDKLKFSKGNEILIPRVGEDPLDFSKCSWLTLKDVAIGEMISVFNTEEHQPYIVSYIRAKLKHQFARVVEGGNVSNLYYRYLEKVRIKIPSMKEQKAISTFLQECEKSLSSLEGAIKYQVNFKKSLLQKMFI